MLDELSSGVPSFLKSDHGKLLAPHRHSLFSHVDVSWYMRHGLVITTRDCARGDSLYTRYPIVARALGLAAERLQPLGRVRARAKESCIQGNSMRNFIRELCPGVFYTYGEPMFLLTDRL